MVPHLQACRGREGGRTLSLSKLVSSPR